ncbi:hypothetical protein [Deinococcus apachensis]|uniref:hypothetical protein n=1 Tax=Deinococcus apachensis TaxID=309886 RepID=UPI0003709A50|nr:hypothetical protein [Deinococcus apachensis]
MKRFLVGLVAILAACGTVPQETHAGHLEMQRRKPRPPIPTPAPTVQPTLVAAYWRMQGELQKYDSLRYAPRQFNAGLTLDPGVTHFGTQTISNAGQYAGWDHLGLPNSYTVAIDTFQQFGLKLNRAAQVGLIWRAGNYRPSWLGSWTERGSVTLTSGRTYPVFVKTFQAGSVDLLPMSYPSETGTQFSSVIVGEANGTGSAAPSVPAGQTPPVPNQTCPAWVHDQYKALGPDGQMYPTWHPQVDPVYWCYFRHEHGSDPKLAGVGADGKPLYQPLYGYTAARHGMTEPHVGFKSHVFKDRVTGVWWNVTYHMGGAGAGRICQRYHTADLGVVAGGVLKADLHLMGDFGRARVFTAPGEFELISGCPEDQGQIRDMGSRTLGGPNTDGYEPWVIDNEYNVTGWHPAFFSVKTSFPQTRCADAPGCTTLQNLYALDPIHTGSERLLEFGPNTRVTAGDHGQNSGVFYTDPHGEGFLPATDAHATRQFIAPGFSSATTPPADTDTGYCTARDAWTVEIRCDLPLFLTGDKSIEGSLGADPN